MEDKEIIKALECCKNGTLNDCDGCPCFNDEDTDTARDCAENLMSNALDLINRLQAENEGLNKELKITRAYLHDNSLEFDLLSYSKRNGG